MRSKVSSLRLSRPQEKIFNEHLLDAKKIARNLYRVSWHKKGGTEEELEQAANLGLLKAVRIFDEKKQRGKFSTFAYQAVC